jgi:hypothetical protein
MRWRADAS